MLTSRILRLVRRRIAIKLTLTLVGFVAVIMLVAGVYLTLAFERFAADTLETRLAVTARLLHGEARALLATGADPERLNEFVVRAGRPTDTRVTLIAADGRVVADSEVPTRDLPAVENHADRPEVQAALAGRLGRSRRTSTTVHQPLFYVGAPIRDGARVIGVLRLALPLSVVTSSHTALHRVMLVGGLVALGVAFGIAVFVSRRITGPVVEMQRIARRMSEGDFTARAPVRSTDEIAGLGRALNLMATRLRDKIQDLEHEHARLNAIVDSMIEGVIAVDGRDSVVLMNERARAMFGVDEARGAARPLLEVVRNRDLHDLLRESRGGTRAPAGPREIQLPGAGERVLRANAVPFVLAGNEVGVVIVLHDVTELRRLEQVRTEFVANVSHELRTPLTAIQGYLETLRAGGVPEPDAARFLEIAFRHTERLGRLLNDLTDLSNIELGKVALHLGPTPLTPVVESVLEIMAPRAEAGGVGLEAAVPDGTPAVEADRDRLAQILINLVDNAVKYTPRGGRVTVTAARAGPSSVEVSVRDTGLGIPAPDLPRITERFYRVDRARSRALGGTGLGLAIVKHLVIAHGGELRIESEPDRGTVVRFTLRIAAASPRVYPGVISS